jgi:arylsulfatase A-like enzyme
MAMGTAGRGHRKRVYTAAILAAALIASVLALTDLFEPLGRKPASAPAAPRGAPNILVIVTDDQAIGTLNEQVMPKTHHYLQEQGRTYTHFFVTDPLCCPSRASIMTGRYNHNNGVTGNTQHRFHLDLRSTLQHYLSAAGYQTWISGKFLNAWPLDRSPPDWNQFTITGGGLHKKLWFRTGGDGEQAHKFRYPLYAERLVEYQARRYLRLTERHDARPWFGYLAFTVPHGPYTPMGRYRYLPLHVRRPTPAERERSIADKWPGYRGHTRRANPPFDSTGWLAQLRMLRQADDIIGRLMKQLREQHELENTIVVFLSDNGVVFGAHRLTGKSLPYTESIQVPAAIRWPHHIPPGSVDGRLSANIDLAPTLLDAARVQPSARFPQDGRDLFDPSWKRSYILTEHWAERGPRRRSSWVPTWASLRSLGWQYIEYYDGRRTVFREYYDLRKDPNELKNVLAKRQSHAGAAIRRLHIRLQHARGCRGAACP